MVTLEDNEMISLASDKQKELYMRLLSSSSFLKSERDYLWNLWHTKIINSYDASVGIDYLICKIRLQKHFNGKRKHSVAQCVSCKSKFGLNRFLDVPTQKRIWLCAVCKMHVTNDDCVPVVRTKSKKVICTEDFQECDKCPKENCMIKTMSSSVSSIKEI